MAEQQFTRCPGCKTIFRVTAQQLVMRGGQVRCGHCHTVFDGVTELLSLAPRLRSEQSDEEPDEAELGPPTVTLREAHALQPPPRSSEGLEQRAVERFHPRGRQAEEFLLPPGRRPRDRPRLREASQEAEE